MKTKEELTAHLEIIEDLIDTALGQIEPLTRSVPYYYYEDFVDSLEKAHKHAKIALELESEDDVEST